MRRILAMLFALLLFFTTAWTQRNTATLVDNEGLGRYVDSLVVGKMREYHLPGMAIGIVNNGSIVHVAGYGIREVGGVAKINANSIFHTASVSKLLTANAIMNLVREGTISLEDPVVKYLPDLNSSDSRVGLINISHLLSHTSGLRDIQNYHWRRNNHDDNSLQKYILSKRIKLRSNPGTFYYYSNLGYDMLGLVIERVTKLTFDDYLRQAILDPAGITNSDFRYFVIQDSLKTSPHSRTKLSGKIFSRKVYPYTREHAPSSTLNASVIDLCKWMNMFMADQELSEAMFTPHHKFSHIGLGVQLKTLFGRKAGGHFGGDKGFRSYLIMFPDYEVGLVILANADFNEDFRQEILHPIAAYVLSTYSD